MKKITWSLLTFALCLSANAQISASENFEEVPGFTRPDGWANSEGVELPWVMGGNFVCEGTNALYCNLKDESQEVWIETPAYTGSNGDDVTVEFKLKIVDSKNAPLDYNWGTAAFKYSTDKGTNWKDLATITPDDLSEDCNTFNYSISGNEVAPNTTIKFKWSFNQTEGNWRFGIDDFHVDQAVTGLDQKQMAELKAFPNPATSFINISYKETIKSVTIFDLTGRKIKEQNVDAEQTELNIQSLSSGTYLMNVQTADGIGTLKFIKK